MSSLLELPYLVDNTETFARLRQLPQALWLDSQGVGEHDLMMALPRTVCHWSAHTAAWSGEAPESVKNAPDSFTAARLLQQLWGGPERILPDCPFQGGIAGYWGYDAAAKTTREKPCPDAAWGWYDWFIAINHKRRETRLVFLDSCTASTRESEKKFTPPSLRRRGRPPRRRPSGG